MTATRRGWGLTAGFKKKDFRLLFIQELFIHASVGVDAFFNAEKA
jgi:hypothetical protein